MSEWPRVRLGDLAKIEHGWPFQSELFSHDLSGRPIVVGIGNFNYSGGFRFDSTALKEYRGDYPAPFDLQPGDILLVMTCQTAGGEILGIPARVPDDGRRYLHNQRLGKLVVTSSSLVCPEYLYWLFLTPEFNRHLVTTASGTKILHTAPSRIESFEFLLPPLSEQRRIAGMLGALEDKIELNRQMNRTAEATARALFKSWFVDFDPVTAKAEGRDPGLPAHVADLFPNSLEHSELGEIPSGWKVAPLDSEFDLTMGQSPPGDTYNEIGDGPPFYQGRVDFGFRFPTRRVYCTAPTRFAKAGDTLVSVRAPVGDTNVAWEDCAIGRGVAAVRHKAKNRTYTYEFMRSLVPVFARFNAEGTVFGSIDTKDFHEIPCIVAPLSLVTLFERLTGPIGNRIESGEREVRALASLRDVLLPKLISGELRITDAERSTRRLTERSPASPV